MSLFNKIFKSNTVDNTCNTNIIDERKHKINLRKEKVDEVIVKNGISNTKARVVFALDESGSMIYMYENGEIQELLERIFPIALSLDDNGELEMFKFNNGYSSCPPVNINNVLLYTTQTLKCNGGGTEYSPILNKILKDYGFDNKDDIPTFVIFVTDGDCCDNSNAEKTIIELSKYNIFFKFIGIGNERFSFLKHLDDMRGRFVDNADFKAISNINKISDNELYDLLFDEYSSWLVDYKKKKGE